MYHFRFLLLFVLLPGTLAAHPIQLKNAVLLVSSSLQSPLKETIPRMVREEVAKRTKLSLATVSTWSTNPVIALVLATDKELVGKPIPSRTGINLSETKSEGFRVLSETSPKGTTIWIIGADQRGILFGTGWLLRRVTMAPGTLQLDEPVDQASAPVYPIRGHQLGYRPTANSYDAWTVKQFGQYIRELAIFGANTVEGIPFHEEENPSPHFKIPAAEMRIRLSEICRDYGMDYWVWTPVTFKLTNQEKRNAELERHALFYRQCPRLDHIFVPGGDPGSNHPRDLLPFLKDLHTQLIKYHPNGKIWVSLQGLTVEQIDFFYRYLDEHKPGWLAGIVSGPSSPPLSETRYRLPKQYRHRQYPDITHNVRCEYPVERWDQAFCLTLGREATNPRPFFFARVHEATAPFTDGFISYSDGCHDDVNKVLWSLRAWNPEKDVQEILQEYSRFFFGNLLANDVANGIAALEHNWQGPLAENGGVETTFSFWKGLETTHPKLQSDWRWQLLLLRAYYDTYTRRRLLSEQTLEQEANLILSQAEALGPEKVMAMALETVQQSDKQSVAPDLQARIVALCRDLFASVGLQTSVSKHQARGYERGCVLDFLDYPLNNRWWLADEFANIQAMKTKDAQLERLKIICTWENPGIGNFYDDVSSVSKGPRINTISDDATDIAWWDNGSSRARLSSQTFQKAPSLIYNNLDPGSQYVLRVAGFGEALLRVDGNRLEPLIYNREAETFKEWIIPHSLTQDGRIAVTFDEPEESHLGWRQHSRISDIWLLKK